MYSVHCRVFVARLCTLFRVLVVMYSVNCGVLVARSCTLYIVLFVMYTVQCRGLVARLCTVQSVSCQNMYSIECQLLFTVYSAEGQLPDYVHCTACLLCTLYSACAECQLPDYVQFRLFVVRLCTVDSVSCQNMYSTECQLSDYEQYRVLVVMYSVHWRVFGARLCTLYRTEC